MKHPIKAIAAFFAALAAAFAIGRITAPDPQPQPHYSCTGIEIPDTSADNYADALSAEIECQQAISAEILKAAQYEKAWRDDPTAGVVYEPTDEDLKGAAK